METERDFSAEGGPRVFDFEQQPKTETAKEEEEQMAEWMSRCTQMAKHPLVRLHNEMLDYCRYVSPTQKEMALRDKAIEKYSLITLQHHGHCQKALDSLRSPALRLPQDRVVAAQQ